MLTAVLAVKLIRQILVDHNSWPESESDSPLKVSRSKIFDDKAILSRDAAMRRVQEKVVHPTVTGYKPPVRRIETKSLTEGLHPLIILAGNECEARFQLVKDNTASMTTLESPVQLLECLVQLFNAFSGLSNAKISYVIDATDPYTGLFISGTSSDGEFIIAQTLLVQT
jgi:hypothetical protein